MFYVPDNCTYCNYRVNYLHGQTIFQTSFLRSRVSEAKLNRGEAWQFYLTKLGEEANYLTVPGVLWSVV